MVQQELRRSSSTLSFGTFKKTEDGYVFTDPESGLIRIHRPRMVGKEKKKKRSKCARCCCIFNITFLVSHLIGIILVAIVILMSKPGYDKSTQDTASESTRQRVQLSRFETPAFNEKLRDLAHQNVSKQELINHVQKATAFAAAAYTIGHGPQDCPNPVGANLTRVFSTTQVKAYLARDNVARQLVIAFRGLSSPIDILNGFKTGFVPLNLSSTRTTEGALVQRGSLESFKTIERDMLDSLNSELQHTPEFSILVTGHNVGGSLAVLAALSIKSTFASKQILCVTQGQPKTFNAHAIDYIESQFPPSSYTLIRAVHSSDGLPTVEGPFVNSEAKHHSTEIWQFRDPALPENIIVCSPRQDEKCSISNAMRSFIQFNPPALPYNAESLHYFDIEMNSQTSVQCGGPGGQFLFSLLTSRGAPKVIPREALVVRVPLS